MGCPLYNMYTPEQHDPIFPGVVITEYCTYRGRVEIGGGRHFYDFFSIVHIFVTCTSPASDIFTTGDPDMITVHMQLALTGLGAIEERVNI